MNKTLISVILTVVILGALSPLVLSVQADDLASGLKKAVDRAGALPLNHYTNMDSSLFDYYLPSTVGRRNPSLSSVVLVSQNQEILMNLDVVGILNSDNPNVLRAATNTSQAMISFSGTSTNLKGLDLSYEVSVHGLTPRRVLLTLQTRDFVFTSILAPSAVADVAFDMLRIARSVLIQKDAIIATYSNKEIINYQKDTLNMFAQLAPESGTVVDMVEGIDQNLFNDEYYDAGPVDPTVPIE